MKKNITRRLLITSLTIVFLGIILSTLVNFLTNDQNVNQWLKDNEIGTKHLLISVVCLVVLLLVLAYLQFRYERKSNESTENIISESEIETDVKRLFDSLQERYQSRYRQKLDGRFEISLEVSENWNGENSRTISEQFNKDAAVGEAVKVINQAFARKGCLLIVGNPGAGKTVLLLKLALDLLNDIKDLEKEPFPVIFNLASWSDEYEKFEDWLTAMLVSGNGLSKQFAATLLQQERIVFLLDGLDELARNEEKEIAAAKRAKCLKSLNQFLDRGKKVVICSRVNEFLQMQNNTGQDAPVAAKVEVLDLTKAQVLLALEHAAVAEDTRHHAAAANLLALLVRQEYDHLLEALRTPFYFTIALEIFDRRILDENDFPNDKDEIGKYLIEQFIERKLEKTPNPKSFKSKKTRKWLGWLARLLEKKEQVTFELANLQPQDLKRAWVFKLLLAITAHAITCVFIAAILFYPKAPPSKLNPYLWFIIAVFLIFFAGIIFILPFCLLFGFRTKIISTEEAGQFSFKPLLKWESWKDILFTSFFYGLIGFLVFLMFSFIFGDSSKKTMRIVPAVSALIVLFTLIERISSYCRVVKKFGDLKENYQRLKTGVLYSITRWSLLVVCFLPMINLYRVGVLGRRFDFSPIFYFLPFAVIISLLNTAILKHLVLRCCLTVANVIPLRYATFLDYATKLRILEKDGGQWRFRHQNLQEYFAKLNN